LTREQRFDPDVQRETEVPQAMSFTQLTTPIPVNIVGKGGGLAFAVIDYGPGHDLIWVSALEQSGEIWCAPNPSVRLRDNRTLGFGRDVGDPQPARGPASLARPEPRIPSDPEPRASHRAQALPIPGSDLEHAAFP
jgi:hypothetical protein